MKTSIYVLLIPIFMFLACNKPAKISTGLIPRTHESPVFELDTWNYNPDNQVNTNADKNSYGITCIKYRPKHANNITKPVVYSPKTEAAIERTRIDDYWSAYLLITENSLNKNETKKPYAKVNRSVMFFSLDSAMLTADIEALFNREKLKG